MKLTTVALSKHFRSVRHSKVFLIKLPYSPMPSTRTTTVFGTRLYWNLLSIFWRNVVNTPASSWRYAIHSIQKFWNIELIPENNLSLINVLTFAQIAALGQLELNANNNDEVKREAASTRQIKFLRALAKQYLLWMRWNRFILLIIGDDISFIQNICIYSLYISNKIIQKYQYGAVFYSENKIYRGKLFFQFLLLFVPTKCQIGRN